MKGRKYFVYGILIVLVISIGVTFAYFQTNVNNKNGKLSINSKEINIIFTDTTEISEEGITPGWSTSKSFSVENKSGDVFNYNIVLEDLINTFETVGNLQYKITSTNGYNMTEYADIPKSKEAKDVILAYDIDIEASVKQEYTIEFIYKNSTEDQSIDMNKELSGVLAITEGSIDPNKKYSVTIELENGTITSENPQESLKKGSLTYTYELNEGYEINDTEVICSGSAKGEITEDNIIIKDIREDQICTISPSKKRYIVDIKVNNGSSDALNKHIEYLGSDIFNITANYGYTLDNATVTGEGCTIEGSVVTVSNVSKNLTCEVTLKRDKYNVYLSGANISVSDSPKLVEYEGSAAFIVTPSVGYTLDNAVVNCDNGAIVNRTNNNVTISNITRETRCEITPVQLSYNVTLVMNNGSVTAPSVKTVNHAGSTTFNVSANAGYNLTNPSITCTGSALGSINGSTVTISNVTTNQTCTVSPNKNTYTVNIGVNNTSMGTVSPSSVVIEHGGSASITISPKTGYRYVSNTCGGVVSGNTMTISNITANKSCTVTFESLPKFYDKLLADNPTRTGQRPNAFNGVYTSDNTGVMYVANGNQTEDGSNVYYFAGNAKNNWVKFGKNEQNQDLYWRIIRTNEDGSVRMLYAGTSPDTSIGYITTQTYNSLYNNPLYVGYMYGESGSLASNRTNTTNSSIKTTIDNWYNAGLNAKIDASGNKYDAYISQTAIYCNDRAHEGTYGISTTFFYAAYYRLQTNEAPSYKCGNDKNGKLYSTASSADKFSKSTSKGGNGQLQYPIALMTADEISFAGGRWSTNAPAWYYYNSGTGSITGNIWWWTMSPSFNNHFPGSIVAYVVVVSDFHPGYLIHARVDDVYNTVGVRPVLSLKSCVTWKRGNGAWNTPYEVELNNSCALAEN